MADPCDQVPEPWKAPFEEARQATSRGWALIALKGKAPRHRGWQASPSADLADVLKWVRRGDNLGLRTGQVSGVIVIDDDSVDGSASAALNLPATVTVITGSGKRHLYFKAPDFKIKNSVKTIADGIDIRGDGGQVVFVGSIHPDTQRPYAWAPGHSPDEIAIAELPPHLLARLQKPAKPPTTRAAQRLKLVQDTMVDVDIVSTGGSEDQMRRADRYAAAALEAEVDRVHDAVTGERNDTLNKAAFALGQLVGGGFLDRLKVHAALVAAAKAIGLDDAEAAATVNSGIDGGTKEPRDLDALISSADDPAHPQASPDPRPKITLFSGWLHRAVDKAERILQRQHPPLYYQRGSSLVRIVLLREGAAGRSIGARPMIADVTVPALVDKLTELIRWEKLDRKSGEVYAIDCPERIAVTLLSRSGSWRAPTLVGVIDCPTLCADAGVLDRPGYDRNSGLYLLVRNGAFPPVPASPTREHAVSALEELLWLLKDFPFVDPADRSVAIAAMLTALIRPSLRTAPLFAFRAAKMGSGKSLLADAVALIATGRPASVMSQGADENEDKKRMLPILAEGDPVAVIDNIERPFGSAALCSILTQTSWRDRVLGKSQTLSLPTTNTTWLATGNNIIFSGDITTRVLVCDLDPKCERPEERKFEVNLHHYIPQHRGELVVAGLTILRAYHVAGRPDLALPVFGRFEEWSNWVRAALVWLGMADPCETRRRAEDTDPVRAELTALLTALHECFGDHRFRVAEVLSAQEDHDALRDAVTPILATAANGQGHAQCLGLFFARVHRRPEGGLRLVRAGTRNGAGTWAVEHV